MIIKNKPINEEQIDIDVTAEIPSQTSSDPDEIVYDKVDTYSQDVPMEEDPIEGVKKSQIDSNCCNEEAEMIGESMFNKILGHLDSSVDETAYFKDVINGIRTFEEECNEGSYEACNKSVDVEGTDTMCPTCSDTVDVSCGDYGDVSDVVNNTMRRELDAELGPETIVDGDIEGVASKIIVHNNEGYVMTVTCVKIDEGVTDAIKNGADYVSKNAGKLASTAADKFKKSKAAELAGGLKDKVTNSKAAGAVKDAVAAANKNGNLAKVGKGAAVAAGAAAVGVGAKKAYDYHKIKKAAIEAEKEKILKEKEKQAN